MAVCRALLVIVILVILGGTMGCATSLVYDRADRLANRWLGGYVALDASQRATLDAGLEALHEWHRREQLPAYAGWLRGAAARLADDQPLSEQEVRELGTALGALWRELASEALPLLLEIGVGLDDAQVAGLLEALREKQRIELEAANRRAAAWHQQRRVRSTERFMRRLAGPLTQEQRAATAAWAATLEPTHQVQHDNRLGWINELEYALARRADPDTLRVSAERLFVAPDSRWSPEVEALVERNSARTTAHFVALLNGLDDRQRARAITRLERLAAEFESLSRAAG
ncbi:MAG: DUF6279 family lipoprotein [Gammaproteobacteria bacterium]